ncbi:MAG: tannase/feruloyl esterase family alpha/beta hydrolase [Acidobacteria bacterium]|nr:tannase/feruloyl esterase family alpha/beta hydrolase [Acidobacteriota bacterium]
MRTILFLLLLAPGTFGQGGGRVQFRDLAPLPLTRKPAIACGDLRSLTDFELSVISARLIPASSEAPAHCRVDLMAQPRVNIQVNLPAAWNTRLYMFGNGGWAGETFEAAGRAANRARGLSAGFVTAATDTGHSAALEPGASFGLNRQELLDFGFRSLHVTAEAAKLLARTYYGIGPEKSYYEGCSQGGRQGLTLAQRFPNDFDGIIAGSPALYQTGTHLARAYWMRGLQANPFPAAKLGLLAARVYEACDAKDGLKDGLIDDPRRCDFKPARDLPRCPAGADGADCFTAGQVAALERIYGDVYSKGKRFFPGWPVGAEIAGPNGQSGWLGQEIDGPNGAGAWTFYGHNFLQYLVPAMRNAKDTGDAKLLFSQVDIENDPPDVEEVHRIIDANDPDLAAFRRHGGKLLMYFGWADPQLNPMMGVEYYEQAMQAMGPSTGDFFRLFMVPGMFHCGGGVGTSQFDAATPVVRWVEAGQAPARIEAARVAGSKVVRTRPLCPYPQVARYKGSGSIDDAANFACVNP